MSTPDAPTGSTPFYRQLSPTCGLRVSPVALGTLTFGRGEELTHMGDLDADRAAEMLSRAHEAGINLIDTANLYGRGVAEEVVAAALKKLDHAEDFLITTKARMVIGDGPNDGGASRWHLLREVDRSLARLGRDHIDLFYLHQWDGQTPLEETLETMDTLVRSGKIRYYGVSNYMGWQLQKSLRVCEAHGFVKPVAQQILYSAYTRTAEYEQIPAALDAGISTQPWSPLNMGLLTGKWRRGQQPDGPARLKDGTGQEMRVPDWDRLYDVVDALEEVAGRHGATIPQVALAWTLTRPGVHNTAVAARNLDQLEDLLGYAALELTEEDRTAIDRVGRPEIMYPHWHQADMAGERLGAADRDIIGTIGEQVAGQFGARG
ncbi:aldo/keto reductase [Nesterenkonia sp. CL21]|uniref:aldo/keto reductase n=1 Tax=Nesterenkonia sp. CL21 TaxID=3064894 RepID=UPI0028787FD7|nr:aldo/keto reductase [Nesterenkonia sp. CL21]MDS2172245.1 aldo/keto reductase [Nesterenkonia sp. CL21]